VLGHVPLEAETAAIGYLRKRCFFWTAGPRRPLAIRDMRRRW